VKFREFIGEPKLKKIRKIVQTNIGQTEADFLRLVARESIDEPIIKPSIEAYLVFGLSKRNLKRVFDYIKSWLIRYNVPYKPINPYLTVYLLNNLPSISSTIINNIKKTKWGVSYEPKGTITVISNNDRDYPRTYDIEPDEGKDYIVLNYNQNEEYRKKLDDALDDMDIISKYFFVKLFEIESGILNHGAYEDMMYSCPMMPNLRLGNVGLIRR